MADRSVTVRFSTREEQYASQYPDDSLAGFNERGEPLRARLEIDTDETVGDEPYKLVYNVARDKWVGQDVFLKYFSNSGDPITVRTTNGVAELVEENVVSEATTETITFTNESEKRLSGIPSAGSVSTEWIGNVLTAGSSDGDAASLCSGMKTPGPNVTFDGERLRIPEDATGVLQVTYTETFARIKSNAAEMGTVVVAVCQGRLAEAEQYEVEYTSTTWRGNPDSECCQEGPSQELSIPASFSVSPGWDKAVYIGGGCPPFTWEITGTGLSIKNAETEEARFNTITAADDACGDGILRVTDACGDPVEAVIETDEGCCEDQGGDPFAWADGIPDAVCLDPSVGDPIGVTGGVPPYSWQVTIGGGVAFWGNASTTDPVNVLFNNATEVTTIRVRVEDSCGEILMRDFQAGMEWSDDNPETIGPEDEIAVSVDGGVGPFSWAVSGSGFSIETTATEEGVNLLASDAAACSVAEITVTDSCGQSVTGYVRGTEGGWVEAHDISASVGSAQGCYAGDTDSCWEAGNPGAPSDRDLIRGYQRWYFTYSAVSPTWNCANAGCDPEWGAVLPDPPCGSPVGCAEWECGGACGPSYTKSFYGRAIYYEWECP